MMKASVLAVVASAQSAAKFPTPGPDAIGFGLGLIQGLVSDNDDTIQCILPGIAPVAINGIQAAKDLISAVKTHNDTLLFKVAEDLGASCDGIPTMIEKCDPAHTDVMEIMDVLKQIKGPVDFAKHIGDDLKMDMDNIFNEAGEAFKAFGKKDFDNFGLHLGLFLHRVVVGKFDDDNATDATEGRRLSVPQNLKNLPLDIVQFVIPFASAVLSDQPDLMSCVLSGMPIVTGLTDFVKDIKEALKDHNMTALTQSVKDIAGACGAAGGIKKACEPVKDDVAEVVRVMKTIENIAALLDHIVGNIKDSADLIESDVDLAFKAFEKKPDRDFYSMGDHLGRAVHRLVIERYPDDPVVV